eukprot:TRINITY_DN3057_c0_g1_i1.p1 TRINITY_DN3057_c0_g1~~TRINITY_DN3057_c0_g1_i1.p1  ORF type:complete len:292 (+),score=61.70 TRINITY_DN3057_c0_g1_i1:89-964(+)
MAGRHHMPRHPHDGGPRGFPARPAPIRDGHYPPRFRLEEELQMQHEEIQKLVAENRRLIAIHGDMRQELLEFQDMRHELIESQNELQRLNQVIANLHIEREKQARELRDKCVKLESELLAAEPLKAEVAQLHAENQRLNVQSQELVAKVQHLTEDIARCQTDLTQVPNLRADLVSLHQELVRTRNALEYEQKANFEQYEQRQSMEKNLILMAREIEQLRAELANSEKRACSGNSPVSYATSKLASSVGYPGPYSDVYGMHQNLAPVEKSTQYGSASDPWSPYDKPRGHAPR